MNYCCAWAAKATKSWDWKRLS